MWQLQIAVWGEQRNGLREGATIIFREAFKKKLRNFGHVAKFLDPPPLGRYGRKKFGRLEWGRTPPSPYRSLDIWTKKSL